MPDEQHITGSVGRNGYPRLELEPAALKTGIGIPIAGCEIGRTQRERTVSMVPSYGKRDAANCPIEVKHADNAAQSGGRIGELL